MRSAKQVLRTRGAGAVHQIQCFLADGGRPSNASTSERGCHSGSGRFETSSAGASSFLSIAMKNTRGRDWGTKREALITIAPNRYSELESAVPMAAKSFPACDVGQPSAFSRTLARGDRPA